jgi:hypothetical protein
MNELEVRAHASPWNDSVELLICQRVWGETRRWAVAEPVALKTMEEGAYVAEPTLRLTQTAAQALMDNLWQCGLRPSEGSGSAGALAATQKHLEDMRKLVFERPSPSCERS